MDAARYQQVKAIFHALLDEPASARDALLQKHCGEYRELRAEVEALLASHDRNPDFLAEPALKVKASDLVEPPTSSPQPTTGGAQMVVVDDERVIGPYRLLEVLGEGGMGTVYKAEQTAPVRRLVALKLIKLGMDTREVIARFEAERQALAMMDHPCIARVLDAGATAKGRPYFVMEYVPGVPITEHADRHNLNTMQRLRLFLDVCEAVHHAHQRAVIHRDLKPSNILVMFQGERAIPKIIDFGIAKATNHHLTERTVFTEQGRIIGTPEYMSPEQAEMTEQGVDIRTDVYSLGVILYELLAGVLPFSSQELRAQGYAGLQRTIREVEPERPSTRITTLGSSVPARIAQARSTDVRTLVRQLRGDLDWIVMKAIAKSRTERYESAFSLSEDIRRYLNDEPVLATRPSLGYRLAKFVRRNRVAVVTGVAVFLALSVGLVLALLAYREMLHKEQEVRTALALAEQQKEEAQEAQRRAEAKEQEARENERRALLSEQEAKASLARAERSERRATESEARQATQQQDTDALVAQAMFQELVEVERTLWPAYPERAAAIEQWLQRAAAIADRLPELRAVRDRLRARAHPQDEAEREADRASHPRAAELAATVARLAAPGLSEDERRRLSATAAELRRAVDERRTWTFDDGDIAMKHAVISKLIEAIEAAQAEGGSIARMRWRLQEANTLRARSVDAHAEAWQAAAEAVRTAPAYAAAVAAGLVLVPQTGLVPLGADPLSGLQEFAVLQTGAPPSRKEDGTLAITEDSALVLVLLPGGAFKMGAAANGDANVDPAALDHEAPVHEVALAPFFLAKHEMTQAQWQRWTGQNPSYYFAGRLVGDRQRITPLNPVETITWYEAEEVLRQLGLELPTEAQWEYAARGGGSSIWIGGDTVADLRGRANFAAADSPPDWMPDRTFADGFLVHAPIDAVAGNGYGLHHMLGNVSEWCRDPYGSYSNPVRGGDGLRVIQPGLPRVHRGGSYRSSPDKIRITARADDPADARSESRGVRPARRLELP